MNNLSVFNPKIIFQSWVDSLKIFLPANFMRFLAAIFKSLVDGVKAVGTHIVWRVVVVGLFIIGIIWLTSFMYPESILAETQSNRAFLGFFLLIIVLFLAWIVAIRPTTEPKDYAYFKRYIPALPGIALIFVIWFSIGLGIANLIAQLPYAVFMIATESLYLSFFLTLFFFIESTRGLIDIVKSFWHSLIFVILNVPGLAILGCLSILIEWSLGTLEGSFPEGNLIRGFFIGISIIDIMISICVLYNYFIQRVNENKSLYC